MLRPGICANFRVLNLAGIAKIAYAARFRKSLILRGLCGRAGEIRTHDLLHPMQAFYQAELRPDLFAERQSRPAGDADDGGMPLLCN